MAKHTSDKSGTGTVKVTDEYLKDFANQKISSFLTDLEASQPIKDIAAFSSGSGNGTAGHYGKLLAGTTPLTEAKDLQQRFSGLCASLWQQIDALRDQMKKASIDLQMIDSTMAQAEDDNSITAAQMMQDLQDILHGVSTPPPSTTKIIST